MDKTQANQMLKLRKDRGSCPEILIQTAIIELKYHYQDSFTIAQLTLQDDTHTSVGLGVSKRATYKGGKVYDKDRPEVGQVLACRKALSDAVTKMSRMYLDGRAMHDSVEAMNRSVRSETESLSVSDR